MKVKANRILDGSSEFYQYIEPVVFGIRVQLNEVVDVVKLKLTLNSMLEHYDVYRVKIKENKCGYEFENNNNPFQLHHSKVVLPSAIDLEDNKQYLFKVSYDDKSIVFEFYHTLCDGISAKNFVVECMKYYDNKKLDQPPLDMASNAFRVYKDLNKIKIKSKKPIKSYYQFSNSSDFHLLEFTLDASSVIAKAKVHQCSVTTLIAAHCLHGLYKFKRYQILDGGVLFSVPINLRTKFPSKTMYNFSSSLEIPFDYDESLMSFEHCLAAVKDVFKNSFTQDKFQNALLFANTLQNGILRHVPINVKKYIFKKVKEQSKQGVSNINLSNLGRIDGNCELRVVDTIDFILPAVKSSPISIAVTSFNERTNINITTNFHEKDYFNYIKTSLSDD